MTFYTSVIMVNTYSGSWIPLRALRSLKANRFNLILKLCNQIKVDMLVNQSWSHRGFYSMPSQHVNTNAPEFSSYWQFMGHLSRLYPILPFRHWFPLDPLAPANTKTTLKYARNSTFPSFSAGVFIHTNTHTKKPTGFPIGPISPSGPTGPVNP